MSVSPPSFRWPVNSPQFTNLLKGKLEKMNRKPRPRKRYQAYGARRILPSLPPVSSLSFDGTIRY